tara:strand:+ start:1229 stop:2173 length:945 start_codon:yes stop_codon:yes gene_type:complete
MKTAVGKITRDDICTHSLVPYIFDEGHFKTKQEILDGCIRARAGENIRTSQTLRQRTGDILEKPLIEEAMIRLGINDVELEIKEKVVHPFLPLEGSLDGLCFADNIKVVPNEDNGVYVIGSSELLLNGNIPIEVKCTSQYPTEEPPAWLGVLQLKAAMSTMQSNTGILIILYQSTDLRIYIYGRDHEFDKELEKRVIDFDRRITEKDYYTPHITKDAYVKYPDAIPETRILPEDTEDFIKQLETTKEMIKKLQDTSESLQAQIMDRMGNAEEGRIGDYKVVWKMRKFKAQPEKVIPPKDAYEIRSKTLTIKKGK